MTDRRRRQLTAAETRQRTEAGRKSRSDATTPAGVLSFAVGHYSQPGVHDGKIRSLYRPGLALVARLNANPPRMEPYPQQVQTMGAAQATRRNCR